jgi:hypothetical protein
VLLISGFAPENELFVPAKATTLIFHISSYQKNDRCKFVKKIKVGSTPNTL